MTRIKICGITTINDALAAADLGADAIGFVFARGRRQVDWDTARNIIQYLPPFIFKIGVFVDEKPDTIMEAAAYCGLNGVQLHGNEPPSYLKVLNISAIKAFRVKDDSVIEDIRNFRQSHFLLDTYVAHTNGGSGKPFDWEIARRAKVLGNVILGGGLNTENIEDALTIVRPYAVDISSGVEISPGKKDRHKLKTFIEKVRRWDNQIN